MHALVREAAKIHDYFQEIHARIYKHLLRVREAAKTPDLSQGDRADLAYLMREVSELARDVRKEARQNRELLDKVICVVWAKQVDAERSVKGSLATATPKIKMGFNVPTKEHDPERYEQVMSHLGFSEELIQTEAVRLHWPGLVEYITARAEEGLPLPPGIKIDEAYPIYSTTLRRRNST